MNFIKYILDKERDGKKGTETIFKNDFIAFNNEDLVLDELIDKNYIHEPIGLPCSVGQFYSQNFDIKHIQMIGDILMKEHPMIFQTFNNVMNGNMLSSGFSFCLQSKLLEDFYNWIIDVLDKFYKGVKYETLKTGEIHRILDVLFSSYMFTYSQVNRGSIFVVRSGMVRVQPEMGTKQKISEAKPEDNGIDIHEKE